MRTHHGAVRRFDPGYEFEIAVVGVRMTPFAERHEVRYVVCVRHVGVPVIPALSNRVDLVGLQPGFGSISATVSALAVTLACTLPRSRPLGSVSGTLPAVPVWVGGTADRPTHTLTGTGAGYGR